MPAGVIIAIVVSAVFVVLGVIFVAKCLKTRRVSEVLKVFFFFYKKKFVSRRINFLHASYLSYSRSIDLGLYI